MINTLAVLLAALTVGTIVLMLLETDPIIPKIRSLIAASDVDPMKIVRDTDAPLVKWTEVVVHATGAEGPDIARLCHFVIAPDAEGTGYEVQATGLWRRQGNSLHILGPNSDLSETSISVCLVCDFSLRRPTDAQFRQLMALVRSLQFDFRIARGHVYLYRDLDASTYSPGRAFPEGTFTARLLRPER